MLFEAWCVAALSWAPCGRPALRSLGCLYGSAARGGVGFVRHETMKLMPSYHAQRRCPSGFVLCEGALPAGSLAGVRRTSIAARAVTVDGC